MEYTSGHPRTGGSPRHELVNCEVALGNMWMKPVARMTPAPKAFRIRKKFVSRPIR